MPLSHTCTDGATGNSDHLVQILNDLRTNLRRLPECPPAEQVFERFEGQVHQLFAVAERAVLAAELERLDVDQPEVTIEGRRHRQVLQATATYTSAVGPISMPRTCTVPQGNRRWCRWSYGQGSSAATGRRWRRGRRAIWWPI